MDVTTKSTLDQGGVVKKVAGRTVLMPSNIHATVSGLDWEVQFRVCPDDHGRPVISELTVRQLDGGPPVGVEELRHFRLGEALAIAVEKASIVADPKTLHGDVELLAWGWGDQPWQGSGAVPGGFGEQAVRQRKPRVSTEDIKTAAAHYLDLAGTVSDVYEAVAERMHVGRATAHRRIVKARELGLLDRGDQE